MPANPDGFKLMKYRSDDGADEEWIWNSRGNVTPFIATLSNGKTAMHVDWGEDKYVPDYVPPLGSIVFVDATEARLRPKAIEYVNKHWDRQPYPIREMRDGITKDEAVDEFVDQWFGDGKQPMQVVVDEEFLAELKDARQNRN